MCVRPSFTPADSKEGKSKGDSHWINVFNAAESGGGKLMPAENVLEKVNN